MRFDYRGVGASQGKSRHAAGEGRIGDVSDEVADLLACVDQLLNSTKASAACAVGYSFGAAVVAQAASDPRIERLVLVAPPTALWDFSPLQRLGKPLVFICAQDDPLCDRSRLPLSSGAQMAVIPRAGHDFLSGLPELGKTAATWVSGGLPASEAAPSGGHDPEPFRELDLEGSDEPPLELDD
jgi:alpha/beta superfamily hydrolase